MRENICKSYKELIYRIFREVLKQQKQTGKEHE